jgi:outer membrane protein OmpA-like peptidoglycan-associated protein
LDKCPGTPAAAKNFIDATGCPLDSDNDGVFDYEDVCPNEAGVKANNGCPEVKEAVKQLFNKALNGIEFQSGKATIKKTSFGILDDIVKVMNENPSYNLSIKGHTDNAGKADKNQKLSEDRANAVKDYMVKKGVDGKRMTAQGFGQDKPVASNSTKAGKAKNRRVEFEVVFLR